MVNEKIDSANSTLTSANRSKTHYIVNELQIDEFNGRNNQKDLHFNCTI